MAPKLDASVEPKDSVLSAWRPTNLPCVALTWLSYGGCTAIRKPLGVIKSKISTDLRVDRFKLGLLDLSFLAPYAIVQVFFGGVVDSLGSRKALTLVLLVAGLSMITFGVWNHYQVLAVLLLVNGSAQAFGWPTCVKAVSSCFPARAHATMFGLWSTCMYVGGVGGTLFAVYIEEKFSWRYTFVPTASALILLSVAVFVFLRTDEEPSRKRPVRTKSLECQAVSTSDDNQTLGLVFLTNIKCVRELSAANFCIKMVRYSFFMWLPLYLKEQLRLSDATAGLMSTSFEVGGFVGSILSGLIVELVFDGKMLTSIFTLLLGSLATIICFTISSHLGVFIQITLLFLAGAMNCGIDPILTASVPSALADVEDQNIKAGLASLINGMGSVGVVLEGPLVGAVVDHFGWPSCLRIIAVLTGVGCILIFRAASARRSRTLC